MEYFFQSYLKVVINSGGRRRYDRYFENEYRRINHANTSHETPEYAVTVHIVDELPADAARFDVHEQRRFKKLFDFEFAISGIGTKSVDIYFKDHTISHVYVTAVGVFLQAQVLEPVMYLSFLKQNIFFMHSAGVSKNKKSYLFPAYGGTGKTTTSMGLLSRGYEFLGDDLIIVDPDQGLAFPYPRPLHVFTYNIRNLQGAQIPASLLAIVYFKNVLRYFLETVLRTEFLISTRVHADEVIKNFSFSSASSLHNIIFLKKEGEHETVAIKNEDDLRKYAKIIVESADLNESLFELIADPAEVALIKDQEIAVASAMLKKANYFGFLNTRAIELNKVENFLEGVTFEDQSAGVPA